ncbi:galactokinase [Paraferrimonas sp. SM1919]|uniref:galactokinase n=1 Tax=Paraferrimonas sp. SM1919 TaxID=2662263 RepID=UPI0013D7A256|nr:galactokinase [Paraferrimonas sp. SM1919]
MQAKAVEAFKAIFNAEPEGRIIAPGRVNLIGEHTDYNDGFVFPASINFNAQVYYKLRGDSTLVVCSEMYPGEIERFDLDADIRHGDSQWGNYIRAMAFALKNEGHKLQGVELYITSDVPQGSGLSSSAALEVAIAGMFDKTNQLNLSKDKIAQLSQYAENAFMGCQCGIMDQLISAKGIANHALAIDCLDLSSQAVAIPKDWSIVIINSNYPRKLVDSEYNQRRQDCEQVAATLAVKSLRFADMSLLDSFKGQLTEVQYRRARHVITENARVQAAVVALQNADLAAMKELMQASHASLRDDFEVTVPATDGLVEICNKALNGNAAVRMTGGGFGGAIVCLCEDKDVATLKDAVENNYESTFGLIADFYTCKSTDGLTYD